MRSSLAWSDPGLPPRGEDQVKASVYAIAFRPDATQMVVGIANLVLVYGTADGDLIHRLKGHRDTIYCVDYASDGMRFASGGADKTVIIWNHKGEGILKYTHNESIQSVAYSPSSTRLASCTAVDFGLWGATQKSVTKQKIRSKILCAKWSFDGRYLALGTMSGYVSVRDATGKECMSIERGGPVWCLAWTPLEMMSVNVSEESQPLGLALGCWDESISFYEDIFRSLKDDEKVMKPTKERKLNFYPCSLEYVKGWGQYLILGGSDRRLSLCTKDGVRLSTICQLEKGNWVWSAATAPAVLFENNDDEADKKKKKQLSVPRPCVAVGSYFGSIDVFAIEFEASYAFWGDRFAAREHMTDVVVHHVKADKRVRVKSRDHVLATALFENRLAIMLPDRINIYELASDKKDSEVDMHYRLRKEKIFRTSSTVEQQAKNTSTTTTTTTTTKKVPDAKRPEFLGITARHVIVADGDKIEVYGSKKEREWYLDGNVSFFRVDGGPPGKEGFHVGLDTGAVLKLYVDNAFPVDVVKIEVAVKMIAVSADRKRLAVVGDDDRLTVFDVASKESIFVFEGVSGVAFHSSFDDMLCYSRLIFDELRVKIGFQTKSVDVIVQKAKKGAVLAYVGSKVLVSLDDGSVEMVDAPQTAALKQHIDTGDVATARKLAYLGATAADWRRLGNAAARHLDDVAVAKEAFSRVGDLGQIQLLESVEKKKRFLDQKQQLSTNKAQEEDNNTTTKAATPAWTSRRADKKNKVVTKEKAQPLADRTNDNAERKKLEDLFQAERFAHAGRYQDAAKAFTRAGEVEKAIDMFSDLRQWDEAKLFAASSNTVEAKDLVKRQALWAEDIEDWTGAAEMYASAGDAMRAVEILGEHQETEGWGDKLADIARNATGKEVLGACAKYFVEAGMDDFAKDVYEKLDDVDALLKLYVRKQQWAEAIRLAESRAESGSSSSGSFDALYVPYAEWLALGDRFDEALEAYRKSGKPHEAKKMMDHLTSNAIVEGRYKDASYYFWLLATETLRAAHEKAGADGVKVALPIYEDHLRKADVYYAYAFIESFFEPFTPHGPEVLFQAARFLINALGSSRDGGPRGISKVKILYTLAKQAKSLGAYKLARFAYDKLQHLKVPEDWVDHLEVDVVSVRAKPLRDNPELLPVCYRCGAANALLNASAHRTYTPSSGDDDKPKHHDVCTSCGHPFIRSFLTFDILPLVEFLPEAPLSDDEALRLIREAPPTLRGPGGKVFGTYAKWESPSHFENEPHSPGLDDEDLFNRCITRALSTQEGANSYVTVTVDVETLKSLRREEVYVCQPKFDGMRATYYKSALPDVHLAVSQHRFFHEEDFEFAVLRDGSCPYSRLKDLGDTGPC